MWANDAVHFDKPLRVPIGFEPSHVADCGDPY
jgi:hypothetical protein